MRTRHIPKYLLLLCLTALPCAAIADGAPIENPKDSKVQISIGESLAKARKTIIKAGWKPVIDTYAYIDGSLERDAPGQREFVKAGYVEIGECAVDRPVCNLHYLDANGRCLQVTEVGEKPKGATIGGWRFDCPDNSP